MQRLPRVLNSNKGNKKKHPEGRLFKKVIYSENSGLHAVYTVSLITQYEEGNINDLCHIMYIA